MNKKTKYGIYTVFSLFPVCAEVSTDDMNLFCLYYSLFLINLAYAGYKYTTSK